MIGTLANIICHFPGSANWVRCLTHVVNLVVKVILCCFDGVKKCTREEDQVDNMVGDQPSEDNDLDGLALVNLMKDTDKEEKEMDDGDEENDIEIEDDLNKVERAIMQKVDNVVVACETKPVCHILYKVRLRPSSFGFVLLSTMLNIMCTPQLWKFAYSMKNSSTILLPEWNKVLKHLAEGDKALSLCIMPRDVSMRWNSTYNMLKFAYVYRDAINQMMDN